jgi:predicted MFS family arabinose efflux permease
VVTGLFTANGPLGVFLGTTLGGWAASVVGWRGAFLGVSLLGMIAAPALLVFVREPRRGAMEMAATSGAPKPLGNTLRLFLNRPTLLMLLAASGLSAAVSYGMLNWIPAYLMREQHMPLRDLARWFGPAAGICMGLGIWGGGALVNAAAKTSLRAYALIPGVAMLVAGPSFALALFASSWQISLALMLLPMVCVTIYVAPALALVQNLAPISGRATAIALLLLAFNIVGLGGGPLAIGVISDAFTHDHMTNGLRWALLCAAPMSALAALGYWGVSRTIVADAELSRLEYSQ